jgi:peptide deformylase
MVCVNPKVRLLDGAVEAAEGCLSLPGVTVTMRRAVAVTLDAYDVTGKPFRVPTEGLLARIWQHEYDHLDGRLIIDRMSETDQIANRRVLKQLKEDYAATRS